MSEALRVPHSTLLSSRRSDDPLDRAETRAGALALLLAEPGLEVTEGSLHAGKRVTLMPTDSTGAVEAWYVLEGTLIGVAPSGVRYGPGDLVSGRALSHEMIFTAESDVRFLYLSTRPQFHTFSRAMEELMRLAVEVEKKDGYTADHCARLQRLSFALGQELGLEPHRLHLLDYGSYLHDVGKVRVPIEILQKAGPLNDEEWKIVRRHPTHGQELVDETFLHAAGAIIHQHHERMDGSGYPFGLSGEEILPEAAIVAIVDTYDAMTTDRSYRKALPASVALEELRRGADLHWPADHVRAFRSVLASAESSDDPAFSSLA